GLLTFNPGETNKPILTQVIGDTVDEPNETYFVNLSNATNSFLGKTQGVVTILNDDKANVPPTIAIANPSEGASCPLGTNIVITADARDNDGIVGRVDFFAGTNFLGTVTPVLTNLVSITWSNVFVGSYQLIAKATDNYGAEAISAPVSVTVTNVRADVAIVRN